MTRSVFAFYLAGTLAACSSSGSTTSHHDAGGHDAGDALTETVYLTGTITNTNDPCLTGEIVSPGGDPACTLVEHIPTDAGTVMNVPVPSCMDTNLAPPCFFLQAMDACPMTFTINYGPNPPPAATLSYSCQLCPLTGPLPDGC